MTGWVNEIVAPHYAWFETEFLPPAIMLWERLNVPSWDVYSIAWRECFADAIQASQSTWKLFYLTIRPFAILSWVFFEFMVGIGKILFQLLLEQGWISLQKGTVQAKTGIIWLYRFQRSLSRAQVLGELGIIAACILIYYLRKWLKRQTYVARASQWCKQQKKKLLQAYGRVVHQVAQVSYFLAMTLPHLGFLGVAVAVKLFFPSVVSWLAYDTYTTTLLSVWYPLICTLGWIHEERHGEKPAMPSPRKDGETKAAVPATPTTSVKELAHTLDTATPKAKQRGGSAKKKQQQEQQPSYMRTTAAQQSRQRATRRRKIPSVYERTKPKSSPSKSDESDEKDEPASPTSSEGSIRLLPEPVMPLPQAATQYWLRYWGIYSLVQAFSSLCFMVPVFGRFVARHPFILSISSELKLLFFVWLFVMEKFLGSTREDAFLAEALPLRVLSRHVTPLLLEFDTVVSEAVSKETWKQNVHSKAEQLLGMFVMVRFISEPFRDWLLHILDEGRVLVVPSLSLLMPSFVTQFGVAYVQFIVPTAKSAQAKSEAAELLYLQYWVLHCLLSGILTWLGPLLWWIPFSTHAIFVAWCHLSFPQTIAEYYSVLEMELVAFGLLKGDPVLAVHETRTVQLFNSLVKRLPSAAEENDDPYRLYEADSIITAGSDPDPKPDIRLDQPNEIEVALDGKDGQAAGDDGIDDDDLLDDIVDDDVLLDELLTGDEPLAGDDGGKDLDVEDDEHDDEDDDTYDSNRASVGEPVEEDENVHPDQHSKRTSSTELRIDTSVEDESVPGLGGAKTLTSNEEEEEASDFSSVSMSNAGQSSSETTQQLVRRRSARLRQRRSVVQ